MNTQCCSHCGQPLPPAKSETNVIGGTDPTTSDPAGLEDVAIEKATQTVVRKVLTILTPMMEKLELAMKQFHAESKPTSPAANPGSAPKNPMTPDAGQDVQERIANVIQAVEAKETRFMKRLESMQKRLSQLS